MTRSGFTLIETIVVVSLTSLIMGVLGSLLVYFYQTNAYVFQHAAATLEARRGITDATRYVREAAYDSDGSPPIQTAATSTLVFTVDTNHDDELDTVSYTYVDGALIRTIDLAGSAQDSVVTISSSVRNGTSTPLFRYFNSAGGELAQPVDSAAIASIRIALLIQIDTNRGLSAFTLSGNATLRNTRL